MVELGADTSIADDLLAALGKEPDFVGWTRGSRSWFTLNGFVEDIDDDVLTTYWLMVNDAEDESGWWTAIWAFRWRLAQMMLEGENLSGDVPVGQDLQNGS